MMDADGFTEQILALWKAKGKESVFRTTGYSMVPTINHGDEIVLKHIEPSQIRRGDLVVFRVGGAIVTHRVIKRTLREGELFFVQKGDNGARAFPLPAKTVVGRVVEIRSGKARISLRNRFARMLGWAVAVIESGFSRPIRLLSGRSKRYEGTTRRLILICLKLLSQMRAQTTGILLRSVRLFCKRKA